MSGKNKQRKMHGRIILLVFGPKLKVKPPVAPNHTWSLSKVADETCKRAKQFHPTQLMNKWNNQILHDDHEIMQHQ